MEDTEAAFVSMIMERLHALEEENEAIRSRLEEYEVYHRKTLHVDPSEDFYRFSDGMNIQWKIGDTPCLMDAEGDLQQLTAEHNRASMFVHRTKVLYRNRCNRDYACAFVPSKATFNTFWRQVNKHAKKHAPHHLGQYFGGLRPHPDHSHHYILSFTYSHPL